MIWFCIFEISSTRAVQMFEDRGDQKLANSEYLKQKASLNILLHNSSRSFDNRNLTRREIHFAKWFAWKENITAHTNIYFQRCNAIVKLSGLFFFTIITKGFRGIYIPFLDKYFACKLITLQLLFICIKLNKHDLKVSTVLEQKQSSRTNIKRKEKRDTANHKMIRIYNLRHINKKSCLKNYFSHEYPTWKKKKAREKGNFLSKNSWDGKLKFPCQVFFKHLSTSSIKRGFWLNNNVLSYNLYREINSTCRLWKLLKMLEMNDKHRHEELHQFTSI